MTKVLITGVTGMLGQAVKAIAIDRSYTVIGLARNNADICVDIGDEIELRQALLKGDPNIIINCAAIVNLGECERNPDKAIAINAAPVNVLAEYCADKGVRLIQVSTDQFYPGTASNILHDEAHPTKAVNAYGLSKLKAEHYAQRVPNSLIIRTNVTGCRKQGAQTFGEWAVSVLLQQEEIGGFTDFYTSTIDRYSLAQYIFDLAEKPDAKGIFNIASRTANSKFDFITALSNKMGIDTDIISASSVKGLWPERCMSCGLDTKKVEKMLNVNMPTLDQVLDNLIKDYKETWGQYEI